VVRPLLAASVTRPPVATTMSAAIHRTAADQIRTAIAYRAAPRNPSTPDVAQRVAREMAFE
jgi:hypothetical protein